MGDYYDKRIDIFAKKLSKDNLNQIIAELKKDLRFKVVFIDYNYPNLDELIFPNNVVGLIIQKGKLETLENLVLSDNLIEFDCYYNNIKSIEGLILPDSLKYLNLSFNAIINIDSLKLPNSLISFEINGNGISNIDGLRLPPNLVDFDISNNNLVNIYNLIFPSSMKDLNLGYYKEILLIDPQYNSVIKLYSNVNYRAKFDTCILKQSRDQHLFLYLNSDLSLSDRNYLLSLINN